MAAGCTSVVVRSPVGGDVRLDEVPLSESILALKRRVSAAFDERNGTSSASPRNEQAIKIIYAGRILQNDVLLAELVGERENCKEVTVHVVLPPREVAPTPATNSDNRDTIQDAAQRIQRDMQAIQQLLQRAQHTPPRPEARNEGLREDPPQPAQPDDAEARRRHREAIQDAEQGQEQGQNRRMLLRILLLLFLFSQDPDGDHHRVKVFGVIAIVFFLYRTRFFGLFRRAAPEQSADQPARRFIRNRRRTIIQEVELFLVGFFASLSPKWEAPMLEPEPQEEQEAAS